MPRRRCSASRFPQDAPATQDVFSQVSDPANVPREGFEPLVNAQIKLGQTLLTGGVKGKNETRILYFIRADLANNSNGTRVISVFPNFIEVPDRLLLMYGLEGHLSAANDPDLPALYLENEVANSLFGGLAREANFPERFSKIDVVPGVSGILRFDPPNLGFTEIQATANVLGDDVIEVELKGFPYPLSPNNGGQIPFNQPR